jgi:hypothetical protein
LPSESLAISIYAKINGSIGQWELQRPRNILNCCIRHLRNVSLDLFEQHSTRLEKLDDPPWLELFLLIDLPHWGPSRVAFLTYRGF